MYERQVEYFKNDYVVITWDVPLHGLSMGYSNVPYLVADKPIKQAIVELGTIAFQISMIFSSFFGKLAGKVFWLARWTFANRTLLPVRFLSVNKKRRKPWFYTGFLAFPRWLEHPTYRLGARHSVPCSWFIAVLWSLRLYYAPKRMHCVLLILAMEFLFVTGFTALLFRGTLSAGTQKNCFSGQNYPPSRQLHLVLLRYIRKIRFTDNQRSSNESKQAWFIFLVTMTYIMPYHIIQQCT